MSDIKFDFNNMFSFSIGSGHGVTLLEITRSHALVQKAHRHLKALLSNPVSRKNLGLEWAALPFQDKKDIKKIQDLGEEISCAYDSVLSLGIGGSYLGLKAAQDALAAPYYNEFETQRKKRSRIYFEGNNLDPEPLRVLLENLNPKKTFVVVISKSGETTETKAVFEVVENWLKRSVGVHYGRQILTITDPTSGSLRKKVQQEQAKDILSFRSLPLLKGVGGRYSELNMGLLHLALMGVDICEVLAGAQKMARRCSMSNLYKNPAYLYAVLQHIAYRKKGKAIAILMPFSELLKSTADWYCQLLAESLGKKYERKITVGQKGEEQWDANANRLVQLGRTPVSTRGTTDLLSLQQNNVEGENNKTVTMIRVERFCHDIRVPSSQGILSEKSFSSLLALAQEATEWALVRAHRPNCTIVMSQLSPVTWGSLIYFFEISTAFEGELLNVNAFDQPGVEGYKNYMYHKLHKPGLAKSVAREIEKHPLKKQRRFIL